MCASGSSSSNHLRMKPNKGLSSNLLDINGCWWAACDNHVLGVCWDRTGSSWKLYSDRSSLALEEAFVLCTKAIKKTILQSTKMQSCHKRRRQLPFGKNSKRKHSIALLNSNTQTILHSIWQSPPMRSLCSMRPQREAQDRSKLRLPRWIISELTA